ncbi:hypothetical protein CAEBREN_18320 [Caenorhabditis brenneri]|uniref:JmjC domain-containing protein n=1 Tax=Caenorhabditis brenneri TaxID=135651 RepID=G0PK29_CAEBE|nr:hypothetical protein CAEBREN_18320 [Caenorhabditis brenneri]
MSNDSKRGQKRPAAKDGSKPKTKRSGASPPPSTPRSATPPPPHPIHPLSLLSILVLACAKAFIPGKDDAFFMRREQWRRQLDRDDLLVGSKEFVEIFARGEALYLHNSETAQHIRVHDDGTNYATKIGDFENIHFFKNKKGLGLEIPALTPTNLRDYLDVDKLVKVISSHDQEEYIVKMEELLELLENPNNQSEPYNLISMECTNDQPKLHKQITLPTFVSENSIIQKLENLLINEFDAIRKQKSNAHPIAKYLNSLIENMPRYQKFLLLSMAGSFTGIHVDPAATSVYYHVLHGFRKVMWMYMERMLIPEVINAAKAPDGISEVLKTRARLFLKEMNPMYLESRENSRSTPPRWNLMEALGAAMGEPLANTRPVPMSIFTWPKHDGPPRRSLRVKEAENRVKDEEESEEEEDEDE